MLGVRPGLIESLQSWRSDREPQALVPCSNQFTTSPLQDLFCLSWPVTQLLCKEDIISTCDGG